MRWSGPVHEGCPGARRVVSEVERSGPVHEGCPGARRVSKVERSGPEPPGVPGRAEQYDESRAEGLSRAGAVRRSRARGEGRSPR